MTILEGRARSSGSTPLKSIRGRRIALLQVDPGTVGQVIFWTSLVALFSVWQMVVTTGVVPRFILPGPVEIAARVVSDLAAADVRDDIYYTLTEIFVGFSIAVVLGVALGVMIALSPIMDKVLSPYMVALQTIPKVAIAPLLIIWLGFGIESKIIIVTLVDVFPILVNAVTGFRNIDARQILLMRVLEATSWQTFVKVRVPHALPYLMAGAQISVVFSVIGAVVGEFLGSSHGLGAQIIQRQAAMDVVGVYSIVTLLTSIGVVLTVTLRICARWLTFWAAID